MPCSGNAPRPDLNCCPEGKHRCRDKSHGGKWHFCEGNATGVSNACVDDETTDSRKKYEKCVCDRNVYKYACNCSSLSGEGDSCTDDDGNTYYTSCGCASYASEILTSNINCSSCRGRNETGECTIPEHCENEAKSGYSCMSGVISCDQCPSGYDKSCTEGVSSGVGKKCGYGCFSEYCSTGYYAQCSGCDASYNLTNSIPNANCTSCVDDDGTHYDCPTCQSGYHWEGNSCVEDEKELSCDSGYHEENGQCVKDKEKCESTGYTAGMCTNGSTFIETCTDDAGTTWGWCVDCQAVDWTGRVSDPHSPCAGYYYCGNDKIPSGKSCVCGEYTYYENCLVKERCTQTDPYDDTPLGSCNGLTDDDWYFSSFGYYKVGEKCTKQDGSKLYCYQKCNSTAKNLAGNDAPQKGKTYCTDNTGTNCAQCGGEWFCDECGERCTAGDPYDDTPLGKCSGFEEDSTYFTSFGYYKVGEKCTKQDGTKLYCALPCNSTVKDLAGNDAPQKGKKECRDGNGTNCAQCGGEWFCDECGERCDQINPYDDTPLGKCNGITADDWYFTSSGYYKVGEKCTKQDGTKLYCYQSCNSTAKNVLGNDAPQKGKKECRNGNGTNCAQCGGKWFCDECSPDLTTCNYEYTEEYCSARGKKFEYKCSGNTGVRYGVCVD